MSTSDSLGTRSELTPTSTPAPSETPPSSLAPSTQPGYPPTGNTTPSNSSTAAAGAADLSSTFRYHAHHSFPAFYTLQPNLTTRASQLSSWSSLILSYCAFHRVFRITTSHPLFSNAQLRRRLAPDDVKVVLGWMAERGRIEWLDPAARGKKGDKDTRDEAWVWWKTPEEWAAAVAAWVDATGQRNTVLTFYELREGDVTRAQEFHGLPPELLHKALLVLVGRGKASVFGEDENMGVKFY